MPKKSISLGKKQQQIIVPIYYGYDENDLVLIDEDSMREEFEIKLKEILEGKYKVVK